MKILIISNTISNGGDFLILDSGIKLIQELLNNNEIDIRKYGIELLEVGLEEYEAVIYVGGPLYINRLLEGDLMQDLMSKLMKERKKVYLLGCGWYGHNDEKSFVYNYKFSEKAKTILSYVNENGILGCRDYLTTSVLRNNGYNNVIMTGCPVWYDNIKVEQKEISSINKIVISDIGMTKEPDYYTEKIEQFKNVFELIYAYFKRAEIIFTFNNGIHTKYSKQFNIQIEEYLKSKKIKYYDLSNSSNGFHIYDDCDLHIGYRVHSHLYSLTRGIPSILICEDARGIGMNQVLGFPVIKANASIDENYENNPYLLKELENEIERLMRHWEYEIYRVNTLIQHYYETNVQEFFDRIKNEW